MDNVLAVFIFLFLCCVITASFFFVKLHLLAFLFILLEPISNIFPYKITITTAVTLRISDLVAIFLIVAHFVKGLKFTTLGQKNAAFTAAFFLFTTNAFLLWKGHMLFDLYSFKHMLTMLRDALVLYSVLIIITEATNPKMQQYINIGIVLRTCILGLSTLYFPLFERFGFVVPRQMVDVGFIRYLGIATAHLTTFAIMLTVSFGYLLSRIEAAKGKKAWYYIAAYSAVIGILRCATRISFISVLLMLSIFFVKNLKKFKAKVSLILILLILYVSWVEYGEVVSVRFAGFKEEQELDPYSSRFELWPLYLKDLIANPHYFLIGNTQPPPLHRDVHNLYIWIIWNGGLVLFVPFLILLRRIYRQTKLKSSESFSIVYPVIGFLVPGLAHSNFIAPVILPIIIAMASSKKLNS